MKRPMIKSLPVLLLSVCLVLTAASCSSWDWSLKYSKTTEENNMHFGMDPKGKKAYVAACFWDGTEEGRRFVIPDTVEGCTVFKLGGFYGRGLPMPFFIHAASDELPTAADEGGESTEIPERAESAVGTEDAESSGIVIRDEEFLFTIVFGEYLTEISDVRESSDFVRLQEDGTAVRFHPVFAFEVDEKNPAFYAEDGRLYRKGSRVLVTIFDYPSESEK